MYFVNDPFLKFLVLSSCLYTFSVRGSFYQRANDITVFSANLAHFMSIAVFFVTLNRFCEARLLVWRFATNTSSMAA